MSLQHLYGYVVSDGPNYIIREKIEGGKLIITVHDRKDGKEMRPNGYMIGSNRLEFDLK